MVNRFIQIAYWYDKSSDYGFQVALRELHNQFTFKSSPTLRLCRQLKSCLVKDKGPFIQNSQHHVYLRHDDAGSHGISTNGIAPKFYERHSVSNNWQPDCLFQSCSSSQQRKHQSCTLPAFCEGNPCKPVNLLTKCQLFGKRFHAVVSHVNTVPVIHWSWGAPAHTRCERTRERQPNRKR